MFRHFHDAPRLEKLELGRYPTPVERLDALSRPDSELWVKRDDRTHEIYGGNKVRKLEWLLADARARGATTVVTIGAVGSHHVLATAYFGRRAGLAVEALLVAQPRTAHVVETIRASLALGLRPIAARSRASAMIAAIARSAGGSRLIPVGGSSVLGSMGYVAAARELAAQVRAGEVPEPDVCVVALGSGGTAAGLAAGFAAEGLKTSVVGVCVADPVWGVRVLASSLVRGCARRASVRGRPRLSVDARFLGGGYGHPTAAGAEATEIARGVGLGLDPTYTAKAFASALWHVRARRAKVVLYWHTLSGAPLAPLLEGAPSEGELDGRVRGLLVGGVSGASGGSGA